MTENERIIHKLCNDNVWFTGGDRKAYARLLDIAGDYMPVSVITHCIWMVSDASYINIFNAIAESGYTEK